MLELLQNWSIPELGPSLKEHAQDVFSKGGEFNRVAFLLVLAVLMFLAVLESTLPSFQQAPTKGRTDKEATVTVLAVSAVVAGGFGGDGYPLKLNPPYPTSRHHQAIQSQMWSSWTSTKAKAMRAPGKSGDYPAMVIKHNYDNREWWCNDEDQDQESDDGARWWSKTFRAHFLKRIQNRKGNLSIQLRSDEYLRLHWMCVCEGGVGYAIGWV